MADQPLDNLLKKMRTDPRVKSVSHMPAIVTTRGDEISTSHVIRVTINPECLPGKSIDGQKIMQEWGIWGVKQVYNDTRNPFWGSSIRYFAGCYGNADPNKPTE